MKSTRVLSVIVVCVWALMTPPNGLAQTGLQPITLLVVGENSPDGNAEGGIVAQEFSLSSGTYISRVDLGLTATLGVPPVGPTVCTFAITVASSLAPNGGLGTIWLQRNESVTLSQEGAFVNDAFSDGFQAVLLPAGKYDLVVNMEAGASPCDGYDSTAAFAPDLFWSFNASGGTTIGTVGQSFAVNNNSWGLSGTPGTAFAFDLAGPLTVPPTGGGTLQIARLAVEGPVVPAPGGPVEVQIGFVNVETGALLGPLTPITVGSGPSQLQSVDLNLTQFVTRLGQRIEVQPVIVQSPNAAGEVSPGPQNLSATVQILDAITGLETLLVPGQQQAVVAGPNGVKIYPNVLGRLQTERFAVMASPTDSCVAQVGFNDVNGNVLISAVQVNLPPGTATTVDLNGDTLGLRFGQSIEVQPVLTLSLPAGAVAQNSVCNASVETFDQVTGRTWTHQSVFVGLPAVQTPAAGTPGTPGVPTTAAGNQ